MKRRGKGRGKEEKTPHIFFSSFPQKAAATQAMENADKLYSPEIRNISVLIITALVQCILFFSLFCTL